MGVSSVEQRWARVIGRALLPAGLLGGVVDDVDFGERWQDECVRSRWDAALLLRGSLLLAWLAPLWILRTLHTFGGLDENRRVYVLERLLKARSYWIRMAAMFLKLTACSVLLGDERALKQMSAYDYGRAPTQLRVQK